MTGRFRMNHVVATALAGTLVLGLVACTTAVSVGVGYRTPGWYSYHGRSPFYRCCSNRPPIVVVPPEPEIPDEPIAVPLPEPEFGGGFDGDFGGGFGGGDFGGGDFGGGFDF